jgi:Uma2 family endonuclease
MANPTRRWTIDELYSLPDDGNKYELVRGQLFVTPAPSDAHETIAARLARILGDSRRCADMASGGCDVAARVRADGRVRASVSDST